MQQAITCPRCSLQNPAGQQFCTNCGAKLAGEGQQQVREAQPAPSVPSAASGAASPQKYVFLVAAGIIFKVIGWVVLVGGILGSIAVAVMAAQGAMTGLLDLLDRGLGLVGVSGVAGAGMAVLTFVGMIGSLLWGLGFLAFAELCNAVVTIEENTRL